MRWRARWASACVPRSARPSSSRTRPVRQARSVSAASCAHRLMATRSGIGHVGTHVVNGAIFALPFDLLKDLEPVALLPSNSLLIITKKTFPANDLKELIAWLKANPGKASAGTSGAGGGSHVNGVYFQNLTGTRFQFVPYRGTGAGADRSHRGADRPDVRPGLEFAGAGAGRHDQSLCGHGQGAARLPRPISRRSTKQACRDSIHRPGTGCGRRRAHRNPSSPSSVPPSWRRWPIPSCKSGWATRASNFRRPRSRPRRRSRAHHKAEIEKWWPIVKAANIKPE